MSECFGISRAFMHPDVRIGWYPARTRVATVITTKPGGGLLVKSLIEHAGIALQSVRNPRGEADPPMRPPVTGIDGEKYAWCYSRAGTLAGWIAVDDVEPDPNAASKPPLLGPAGRDFEVGRTLPQEKKPSGCGRISRTKPLRRVEARDTFLRYSERGSAFHYLHAGDVVRLILVDAPHGFCFVEVQQAGPGSSVHPGYRGWTQQVSLASL